MRRFVRAVAVAAPLLAAGPALAQERYLGEVLITAASYCPQGTLPADGRELPVNANQALFSLIGWTYGGDGRTTFALPDLRGRSPVQVGMSLASGMEVRSGQRVEGAPAPRAEPRIGNVDLALDATPDPDAAPVAGAGLGLLHCLVVEGVFPPRG